MRRSLSQGPIMAVEFWTDAIGQECWVASYKPLEPIRDYSLLLGLIRSDWEDLAPEGSTGLYDCRQCHS